jgi:hypothetical protein
MNLKYKLASLDLAPAEVKHLYTEQDGSWLLNVEGAVEKSKVDEFRTNNIALMQERDALLERYAGIDPDEVRQLAAEKQRLEEAQQIRDGEVEKVIESRTKSMLAEFNKRAATLASERDSLHSRLSAIQIDQAVIELATKRGLEPTAIPDITARAHATFKLVGGAAQPFESDGRTVLSGRDGAPMSIAEWLDVQAGEAPHLFAPTNGCQSTGASPGGASSRTQHNPWKKETWNLTEQMRITRSNPQLAEKLRKTI